MYALPLVAALLGALAGQPGAGATLHCAMRREISPCTCTQNDPHTGTIIVHCNKINTFEDITRALTNKFSPETKIDLRVSYSQLPDFEDHSFRELGLSITKLWMTHDLLSDLKESVFLKLDLINFLCLSENLLPEMPRHILRHIPHVHTLDLSKNKITTLTKEDFKDIQEVDYIVLVGNEISRIDTDALPKALRRISLAGNHLVTLNGTLRDMEHMEWMLINNNTIQSLDNELPIKSKRIEYIHAPYNELQKLPQDLRLMPSLRSLYFYANKIQAIEGAIQKSSNLIRLTLADNLIKTLAEDEFEEAHSLEHLDIANNQLVSLNGSLRSLVSLRYLNLTGNHLPEFSLQEIKGLTKLSLIDLSYNKITQITGNLQEDFYNDTKVLELRLDHNYIHTLGSVLKGLHGLMRLNLSNNQLQQVSSDDLIGLDRLELLDVSYNHITSFLTSKRCLPSLEELIAHHNNVTILDKNLHGLPSLCTADFSYNNIKSVNQMVVSKSSCTINRVPSTLKIYLQDNPVLCDDRFFDLKATLERMNTRVIGTSKCSRPPTSFRTLNDIEPDTPVIVVAQMEKRVQMIDGREVQPPQFSYRRLGTIIGHVLPEREGGLPVLVEPPVTLPSENSNVVVKWPDERRDLQTLSEHLRLRDLNANTQ
ncbi:protein artichoke-like [Aricia agestis]|uniref:protein artichoke-like n=1 Tax=Aricia agestis TaxID=91739 RepID=UPI001C201FB9|nr:protein artichoke-like [Aricia agestis]